MIYLLYINEYNSNPLISNESCLCLFQTETPLLIKPYLSELTRSEIHAVMTGGFASISGSILGAFIAFGVSMEYVDGWGDDDCTEIVRVK